MGPSGIGLEKIMNSANSENPCALGMERYIFGPITDRNMHHGAESTRCGQIDVAKRATDLKSKWRREKGLVGREGRSSAICHALACLFSKRQLSSRDRPTGAPSLQLIYVWGLALVCRHFGEGFLQPLQVRF